MFALHDDYGLWFIAIILTKLFLHNELLLIYLFTSVHAALLML